MVGFNNLNVAVVGTGFIGTVHVWALRRLGINIAGVLGSSAERGTERAKAIGVAHTYATLEDLLADPAVDAVHVTSPNYAHYAQVKAILAAGKHVICEKPLAMTSAQSAEMVEVARARNRIAAVCYNTRFYPLNQQAQGMVLNDELGDIRLVTGHYHQDWLAKPTDWNWRLETDEGGALRSVADIGTHWIDLTSFICGQRPTEVLAELATFIPERQRPLGSVETFSQSSDETTEKRQIKTDDAALILLRFANGGRGAITTSQVSHGRKNAMQWEISGAKSSAAWHAEHPDHLWIGHRDGPNQILQRDAALMNARGGAAANLPGGHVEGFADTFFAMFRGIYTDVLAGQRSSEATYASFDDGHYEMQFCDAVIKSAQTGSWTQIAGNTGEQQ